MKFYCAPLEGVTDDVFRTVHAKYFPGIYRYYTPFLSPAASAAPLTPKALREILPEHNRGIRLVPQLLTNSAESFVAASGFLREYGYTEVNLNIGCPSGTVCAKGRGAGALRDLSVLEAFLGEIFEKCPMDISVKTRLGYQSPEEFYALMELLNRFPITELTVHPRVRADFYREPVRMEYFRHAQEVSKAPLCLSGGISTRAHIVEMENPPPAVMLGRSLVTNPALHMQAMGTGEATAETLKAFHDELFDAVMERLGSPKNTIFRMKEVWGMLIYLFDDREKLWKALRKSTSLTEYQATVARIFRELPLRQDADIIY